MDGLVIGLDLNDDYTQICCYDKEKSWTIPTVICRRKEEEVWLSGRRPMRPPCWERELSWISFLRWRPRMEHPPSEASATAEVRCLSCS